MMEIHASTVMEAWRRAIKEILERGQIAKDEDGRECREVLNLNVTVEQPDSGAEAVRMLRSTRAWVYPNEEELTNVVLHKEASPIYDYMYGQRLFDFDGTLNQIDDYVIPLLQQRPNSRRAVAALYNPLRDMRLDKQHFPSFALVSFRVVEQRLVVTTVFRSSEFLSGWPANLFQVAKLQEHVARALGLPRGPITTTSLSGHLHLENLETVEALLGKETKR